MKRWLVWFLLIFSLHAFCGAYAVTSTSKASPPAKKIVKSKTAPKKVKQTEKSVKKKKTIPLAASKKSKTTSKKPQPSSKKVEAKKTMKTTTPNKKVVKSHKVLQYTEIASEEAIGTEEAGTQKKTGWKLPFEIGGRGGLFAAAVSIFGEMRIPLRGAIGQTTSSLRLSGGFAQNGTGSRRYIPVCVDGIINLPAGMITGVDNYLGAGLNYVALTSGRVPGTVGGEVFYGINGDGFGGEMFGEVGFGLLRTGFSDSQDGLIVSVGYRR